MNNWKKILKIGLIVFVVVMILLLFIFSLGTYKSNEIKILPNEFKDTKEEAKRKHKRLVAHIQNQVELSQKLEKIFKCTYFSIRLVLVALWFSVLSFLYIFKLIQNIGDALDFSEASIFLIIAINFITFGTISNLQDYIAFIKTRTENWIYGKYINIDQKIADNKNNLVLIEQEIKS